LLPGLTETHFVKQLQFPLSSPTFHWRVHFIVNVKIVTVTAKLYCVVSFSMFFFVTSWKASLHACCCKCSVESKGPTKFALLLTYKWQSYCLRSLRLLCSFPPNHLDALSHDVVPASSVTWWTFHAGSQGRNNLQNNHTLVQIALCVLDSAGKFDWKSIQKATLWPGLQLMYDCYLTVLRVGSVNRNFPICQSVAVSFGILYPHEYAGTVSDISRNVTLGSWHSVVTPSFYW